MFGILRLRNSWQGSLCGSTPNLEEPGNSLSKFVSKLLQRTRAWTANERSASSRKYGDKSKACPSCCGLTSRLLFCGWLSSIIILIHIHNILLSILLVVLLKLGSNLSCAGHDIASSASDLGLAALYQALNTKLGKLFKASGDTIHPGLIIIIINY